MAQPSGLVGPPSPPTVLGSQERTDDGRELRGNSGCSSTGGNLGSAEHLSQDLSGRCHTRRTTAWHTFTHAGGGILTRLPRHPWWRLGQTVSGRIARGRPRPWLYTRSHASHGRRILRPASLPGNDTASLRRGSEHLVVQRANPPLPRNHPHEPPWVIHMTSEPDRIHTSRQNHAETPRRVRRHPRRLASPHPPKPHQCVLDRFSRRHPIPSRKEERSRRDLDSDREGSTGRRHRGRHSDNLPHPIRPEPAVRAEVFRANSPAVHSRPGGAADFHPPD